MSAAKGALTDVRKRVRDGLPLVLCGKGRRDDVWISAQFQAMSSPAQTGHLPRSPGPAQNQQPLFFALESSRPCVWALATNRKRIGLDNRKTSERQTSQSEHVEEPSGLQRGSGITLFIGDSLWRPAKVFGAPRVPNPNSHCRLKKNG